MQTLTENRVLTAEQIEQYERDGYFIARGLVSPEETQKLLDHFMQMHEQTVPGHYEPPAWEDCNDDVLRRYPRIMMPHRYDETSKSQMLDARYEGVLHDLFGEEALASQSMFYFKPPGARGQALHQDNFYLLVSPGTCMAAWLSLDDADEENGGMFVVPGSHKTDIQCPHVADLRVSFTTEEVDIPKGMQAVPCHLKAGDVLFFNGSVIHGSYPNTSSTRFRRAFICHYVPQSMTRMSGGYYPLHTFAGETLEREVADGGGVCGTEEWNALREARGTGQYLS
jgi:ectoine hydroxylase-related dioxygenase (phytanoyl-CoA dioxygenase family)